MRTEQVSIYTFEELSEAAKEKARDWYREGALDHDWYDSVYDDADRIFKILGIESAKPVQLVNGATRWEPAIWFSGFASQGDGACFEGTYRYAKGSARAIKRYAPKDEELHRIADGLTAIQKRHRYTVSAALKHSGHYYHDRTVDIDVDWEGESYTNQAADAEEVRELLRALMRWIYRQLEAEHDYQLSDKYVDETIDANEYEFTADGRRA